MSLHICIFQNNEAIVSSDTRKTILHQDGTITSAGLIEKNRIIHGKLICQSGILELCEKALNAYECQNDPTFEKLVSIATELSAEYSGFPENKEFGRIGLLAVWHDEERLHIETFSSKDHKHGKHECVPGRVGITTLGYKSNEAHQYLCSNYPLYGLNIQYLIAKTYQHFSGTEIGGPNRFFNISKTGIEMMSGQIIDRAQKAGKRQTLMIGGVVTTAYVNALGVHAASVDAENLTGTYIYGKMIVGGVFSGGTINVQDTVNITPSYTGGINFGNASIYREPGDGTMHINAGLLLYCQSQIGMILQGSTFLCAVNQLSFFGEPSATRQTASLLSYDAALADVITKINGVIIRLSSYGLFRIV